MVRFSRRRRRGNALNRDRRGFLSWVRGQPVSTEALAGPDWFLPDWCGFISMGCGLAVLTARNQSVRLQSRRSHRLSSKIAAGQTRRPWPSATPPPHPRPVVLAVKASLEVLFAVHPRVTLRGYTLADASSFRHVLGCCRRCDNVHTRRQRREFMRLLASMLMRTRPLACHARPPAILHLYFQLHKLWLIIRP